MIQYLYTWFFFSLSRMKYEWVCEHVVVLDACYTKKIPPNDVLVKKKKKKKWLNCFYTGEEQTNKEELKSEAKGYFFCRKVDRPADLTNMQMIILARFLSVFWCQRVSLLRFPFSWTARTSLTLCPHKLEDVELCICCVFCLPRG